MSIKKVICQHGMEELGRALEEYGYELVPSGGDCDAYVYNGGMGVLEAIPGSEGGLPGTLVVNARGLTARQVAAILEKGAYTPLF